MTNAPDNRPAGAFSDPDLMRRIASGVTMAIIALLTAYLGGYAFKVLWIAAGLLVLWEWNRLVGARHDVIALMAGGAVVCLASLLVPFIPALVIAICALLAVTVLNSGPQARIWALGGVLYAALLSFGPIILRHDPHLGFAAIIWLFAIVWGTDVGAYFAGRSLGGPKLWPRLSPKKTWSGFIGGTLVGTLLALGLMHLFGIALKPALIILTYGLAALSQGGDLMESAIKRRFGAKDASGLIPGHGGVMDRLDAFVVAASAACLIGMARGGIPDAAKGALLW